MAGRLEVGARLDALGRRSWLAAAVGWLWSVGEGTAAARWRSGGEQSGKHLALGHLHKAQKVAGEEHLRYSGSPIPLSFDEIGNDKQVLLAEFSEGALQSVTPVAVPHTQPMARWKGNLQQLEARFQELEPLSLRAKPLWLDIEVQEDDYLSDLHNRLQALAEEHGVEILRLRRQRQRNRQGLEQQSRETLSELNIDEVFERRLSAEALENDPAAAGLRNAFAEIRASLDEELNG